MQKTAGKQPPGRVNRIYGCKKDLEATDMKRTELNDIELNRVIGGDAIAECLRAWEKWALLPLHFTPKERMPELQLRLSICLTKVP